MSALKIACNTSDFLRNTGSNSALLPGAPVMLLAMSKTKKFTLSDMEDPVGYFTEAFHALGDEKVFPLFGNQIPVDFLANNDSQDVTQTTDRGDITFVQYGFIIKNLSSLSGGLCFAKALQSFNNARLAFIEIDSSGNMLVKQNSDGTFSGMPASQVFAPKITSADFKNKARNNLQISYDPITYVNSGKLMTDASQLLDSMGLIDLKLGDAGTSTIAHLRVSIVDSCCGDSMTGTLGADLLDPTNFVVKDQADNSVIAITGVTVDTDGETLLLAGTFVAGHAYIVAGATSDILFGNDIEGYDITESAIVAVPA